MVPLPDGAVRLTDYPNIEPMQRPIVEASSRLSVEASSEEESDKLRKETMLFQLIDRRRRIRQHIGTIVVENKPSLVSLSRTGIK